MTARTRLGLFSLTLLCAGLAVTLDRLLTGHTLSLSWGGQRFVLNTPERLALCAAWPLLMAAEHFGLTDLSRGQRALSLAVRSALLVCLALGLCRPARLHATKQVSVVLALDTSDSLGEASHRRARAFVDQAMRQRGTSDVQLVSFARKARVQSSSAQLDAPLDPQDASAGRDTDLQAALALATAMHTQHAARRVVVLSDGNQTRGNAELEAVRAARLGVEIDYVLLTGAPPPEVAVRSFTLPDIVELGRPFRLRAVLFATTRSQVRLRLFQSDVPSALSVQELTLGPGDTSIELPAIAHVSGPVTYRIELTPRGPDRFAGNNQVSATGIVRGRTRVLFIDSDPTQLSAAGRALAAHQFDVDMRAALAMPRSVAELAQYDFVVLSDVAADALPAASLAALEAYVRERGGGFLMAGGDHSFGLGGYQNTALARIIPVQMAGEVQHDEPALALALLIDCSGSMAGAKIELAKEAARATVAVLGEQDLIEVIGFAGEPERLVRMQRTRNRTALTQSIARLLAQGGTQLFPALDLAYQDLALTPARLKHVILLTDGQTQESGIPEIVQAMRSESITVSTVGLGRDVNRELLQNAASFGGGRAYFTDDPHNVPRIFVHETTAQKRNSAVERTTRLQVREPAEFLRGIELAQAPAVRGYVATQAKGRPAQLILESETGEPLLARVRVGLGYSLAFTPDLKARWTADLLRWPSFDRFFAQLVHEHARKAEVDELPMRVTVQQDRAHVVVDAIDHEGRFIHDMSSTVELRPSSATTARTPLLETAPGRYEASLQLPGFGAFALTATHSVAGHALGQSHAQAQYPFPNEYLPLPPDEKLLARIAALTGGRALVDAATAFRPARVATTNRVDLWPYCAWFALTLFLLDLLARRVRLFDRQFKKPALRSPER